MTLVIEEDDYLAHYGILRKSGRYPWGSGGPEYASNKGFLDMVSRMQKEGMSEVEIAKGLGISTTALRAAKTIAKNEEKASNIATAQKFKDKGYSNVAIGERMGINESSVRSLLAPGAADKAKILDATSSMLKQQVDDKGYIDIGGGVEHHVGVSRTKLDASIAVLKEKGYEVIPVQVDQLGTSNKTTLKVLAPPGTTYRDVVTNKDKIVQLDVVGSPRSLDGGRTYFVPDPPKSIDSKRLSVRYAEEGGTDADGVMYIRPGAKDLDLGASRYAQVRIAVDGTHYLKGMAMYKDDLPPGVDIQFNTNKSNTGNKLDALKKMKRDADGNVDQENPFGSAISGQRGALNIVNEEGDWSRWSRNMSSQMLSKQSPALAKTQLDETYSRRKTELENIKELTNPSVRKKLLEAYADGTDAAAVHLKAAALPRTASHVILPINTLKETEIYAPNYRNGERVALVRFPHGGIFEIPELVVNNNHPDAKKAMGRATDAVGINAKVAQRLSGADFDGDTVLVIPNNKGQVKTKPPLQGLIGFDPQARYPGYEGMPKMSARTKGIQMGLISNLITDMTIGGASDAELARAVRHSMVVIDAEKHNLNYKKSAEDNGIKDLYQKYQGGTYGASTLISRASSTERVNARKAKPLIDKKTGEKIWIETGENYVDKNGKVVYRKQESTKLGEAKDARSLISENNTKIERVYADHSNRLKDLANQARLDYVNTANIPYSPSAKKVYAEEVASLNSKLALAQRNRPLERQAQLIANLAFQARRDANPELEASELKKIKGQELTKARVRVGAHKDLVEITDKEWAAIQAGAIAPSRLESILDNANLDRVRELATPRDRQTMTATKTARAKQMAANGYTQSEIADALGVSTSTVESVL